ncbi:hypothetical protein [Mucilaginibacter sp. dw_454]|uniref:hypothetical protein n=1 Tax=Mucilaginibacter sp. dw_454 TaxID=2720079 RepID=UPI001BD597FF|nr:hypothetical protein [Mucilaginibacter sp. dw_454]
MKKLKTVSLIFLSVLAIASCKKANRLCCVVMPPSTSYVVEFAILDSAGNNLFANANSALMKGYIYETYQYNTNAVTSKSITDSMTVSFAKESGYLITNEHNQQAYRFTADHEHNPFIIGFGKLKKDTITSTTTDDNKIDKIWVNGVLKYDVSYPSQTGFPYFTIVK